MKVIVTISADGRVRNLNFKGDMDAKSSPMGLPFDAWLSKYPNSKITKDIPATKDREREVTLDWSN